MLIMVRVIKIKYSRASCCSALNAEKLMGLGWNGRFKIDEGAKISIVPIKEK